MRVFGHYEITSEVIEWYNDNARENRLSQIVPLTEEHLQQLNEPDGVLTINLRDLGVFPPTDESYRLINIEVREMQTSVHGVVGRAFSGSAH